MRTLYKYYNNLPKEYFLDPSIKLTPPSQLNDPFENIIPQDIFDYINTDEELKSETHKYMKRWNYDKSKLTEHILKCLNNCGVVSLSETPRNLLMWAHYGDQHRGICVGYKESLLDSHLRENETEGEDELPYFHRPIKVNYDSTRLAPNETKILKYENKTIIYNILTHVLTTKSDEWIYEKEHRCIVPIYWCDAFITKKASFKTRGPDNGVIKLDTKECIYHSVEGNMYKFDDGDDKYMKFLSMKQTTLLKMISSEDIDSLYFGCKTDKKYIREVLDLIESNKDKLGHIKVFFFTPNHSRFSLDVKMSIEEQVRP
ncbi:DUF2971 domain-containing protein [Aeromonas caviae]|uniref:DUF2971 domain-containing protein n=1 Tax=Aeromonas caviae TaxID=648 RepID=UPI00311E1F1D